jgi:branched-chain amino acid transport system substrate-binding protein
MARWPKAGVAGLGGLLLCLGLGLGQCAPAPDPEIRIGVLSYITGERRETSGVGTGEAVLLAERLLEEAGGLHIGNQRYRVRLLIRDIGDRADLATSEARRLLNEDGVIALIGPQFSRDAIPVSSLAEQARVPMITPMSSHPRTTEGKRFVFRVAYIDDIQGGAMARFAWETLGARKAALLYDVAGEYNRNLAQVFREAFQAAGGTIVADEQFTSDEANDFTTQLARVKLMAPDVVFSPNFIGPASLQLVQARRMGITATFLGTDSWDPDIMSSLVEARGSFATTPWHTRIGSEEADRFIERYRNAYGRVPLATAAATFDAMQLLFHAIEAAGSVDPAAIRDALAATEGFRGVTGDLSYRGGADPRKSVFILRVDERGGEFVRRMDPL